MNGESVVCYGIWRIWRIAWFWEEQMGIFSEELCVHIDGIVLGVREEVEQMLVEPENKAEQYNIEILKKLVFEGTEEWPFVVFTLPYCGLFSEVISLMKFV
jgi:hypothetical protein